ncbi:MAG: mechanosensitive ion channel family protein [Clostridia bacterium]|jgi:small-conductance mechanosensitive channel|nr:mechanosensitive ion channel family protein [Clostridia bacterium]
MQIIEFLKNNEDYGVMVTVILIFLVTSLIKKLVIKKVDKKYDDIKLQYSYRKKVSKISMFLYCIIFAILWAKYYTSLATFLGLFTAGLAIALQDLVLNFAGWLFIVSRKPFELEDRIQIGEFKGDVIDIRIFEFSLLEVGNWVDAEQSTGRIIHVPNGRVLKNELSNYNKGLQHVWHELPILVTFESDWKKAKELLTELVDKKFGNLSENAKAKMKQNAKKYMIFYPNLTPIVYTSLKESGVMLTIRYLTKPRYRRTTEQMLTEEILDLFNNEPDIDFAYPTKRVISSK